MDYVKHLKERMTQAEIDSALMAKMEADEREIARLRDELTQSRVREAKLLQEVVEGASKYVKAFGVQFRHVQHDYTAIRAELEAAQAREAKLREALHNVAWLRHPSERSSILIEKLERLALDALALPHDDSALKERLKAEQERYEGWREAVAFYVRDHCADGEAHAETISAMGESCS